MSLLLDLIFPRPYHNHTYFGQPAVQSVKYFSSGSLDGCLSLFSHRGSIRQLLSDIKYHYVSDACSSLAEFSITRLYGFYPNLIAYWQNQRFVVTSIPLHPSRRHWRGFNQSELLAQVIATGLHLPYQSILSRPHYSPPQVSLNDKSLRSRNLSHAFTVTSPAIATHIILFDDVATTYSTLKSASLALKQFGAISVWGLTIAGSR